MRLDDHGTEGIETSSEFASKDINDLSNDFSNTFMLDEELEVERKAMKKDDLSSFRRYAFLHPCPSVRI